MGHLRLAGADCAEAGLHRRAAAVLRMWIRRHLVRSIVVVDEGDGLADRHRHGGRRDAAPRDRDGRPTGAAGAAVANDDRDRARGGVAPARGQQAEGDEGSCETRAHVTHGQKNFREMLKPIIQVSLLMPLLVSCAKVVERPLEKLIWNVCPPARISIPKLPWATPGL